MNDDRRRDDRRRTIRDARASGDTRLSGDGPTHPRLAAALLMIGVVVLLFVVALASSI